MGTLQAAEGRSSHGNEANRICLLTSCYPGSALSCLRGIVVFPPVEATTVHTEPEGLAGPSGIWYSVLGRSIQCRECPLPSWLHRPPPSPLQ